MGFARFERVRAVFGSVSNNGVVSGVSAIDGEGIPVDEKGTLASKTVRVPNLPPGETKLILVGQALNSKSERNLHQWDFSVGSETTHVLTVRRGTNGDQDISSASPGDRIRVYINVVNTFQPNESVTVTYPGLTPQTTTATANGSIPDSSAASFTVPGGPGGERTITAVGTKSKATRTAKFTVVPKVTLLVPSKFDLGDQVTIDGVGAGPNERLHVFISPTKDNSSTAKEGIGSGARATVDTGRTSNADGTFRATFRVLNELYINNPQNVRIYVKSLKHDDDRKVTRELSSPWFGHAVQLQVWTKGVRVTLSPKSRGPGDAVLTLEGTAADKDGNIRIQENIGNVELAHGSVQNGQRQKIKYDDLTILDSIGANEKGAGNFATIRTNLQGRFKASIDLTSMNDGKPVPSGLVTIYVGGELVTTSYTVTPELRLTDADNKPVSEVKLGQNYTLKGVSFSRTRAVTLLLGGKEAKTTALTTDNNGEFSTEVKWSPGGWVGGAQKLTAETLYDDAELQLTILGAITNVTAGTPVKVGDEVVVSGHGYGAEEELAISVGGNDATATEGGTTNADGTFTATIAIPASSAGAKDLSVTSATSSASIAGAYAVDASLIVETLKAEEVSVTGTGYGSNEAVSIAVAGESPVTATADANGSFTKEIALTAARDHGASVVVTAGSQTASFLYDSKAEAQNISVSPNPAGSGKTVTVSAHIEKGSTAAYVIAGVETATGRTGTC